jgi:hypothetical protein
MGIKPLASRAQVCRLNHSATPGKKQVLTSFNIRDVVSLDPRVLIEIRSTSYPQPGNATIVELSNGTQVKIGQFVPEIEEQIRRQ